MGNDGEGYNCGAVATICSFLISSSRSTSESMNLHSGWKRGKARGGEEKRGKRVNGRGNRCRRTVERSAI